MQSKLHATYVTKIRETTMKLRACYDFSGEYIVIIIKHVAECYWDFYTILWASNKCTHMISTQIKSQRRLRSSGPATTSLKYSLNVHLMLPECSLNVPWQARST
jgi:hypothetical protein